MHFKVQKTQQKLAEILMYLPSIRRFSISFSKWILVILLV